ncbi:uncharacterized protein FOBCDRAFT_242220 [Fusarium oxysporum Fo47]|uniref:uncharacterized protein n=1 Tax=Fusarium oxysporum Fo47 TaxID=660027 RepID=UPI002869B2AD|nr:uncharacterized protein FOBCDRAFT_242220 [Fusarium oxysporum Fo47]WJG35920.1 hypothetical protein FOBCDRAFT_242220 [Fusarium oxysporum Fo47]
MKRPFGSTQTDHVAAAEMSETTPWLQHTRCAKLFRNRPLISLPPRLSNQPFSESFAEIEAQLRIILQGLDLIFDRARATLDRTPTQRGNTRKYITYV